MELFVKYGGIPFWSDFIDQLYEKVTQDLRLESYFSTRNVRRIKEMQLGLLEMTLTSGKYEEQDIQRIHENLHVTPEAFDHFFELYELTLAECDVEQEDITQMIGMLVRYKSSVVQHPN